MTVYINGKRRNVLRIVCENSTYVRNCFPGNPKICLRNVNHANMIHTKRIRTYVSTNTYVHRRRTTVWHCLYKGSCTLFLFHLTPVMSLKSLRSQMYAPHQRSAYVQTFVLMLLRTLYVRMYVRTYAILHYNSQTLQPYCKSTHIFDAFLRLGIRIIRRLCASCLA